MIPQRANQSFKYLLTVHLHNQSTLLWIFSPFILSEKVHFVILLCTETPCGRGNVVARSPVFFKIPQDKRKEHLEPTDHLVVKSTHLVLKCRMLTRWVVCMLLKQSRMLSHFGSSVSCSNCETLFPWFQASLLFYSCSLCSPQWKWFFGR